MDRQQRELAFEYVDELIDYYQACAEVAREQAITADYEAKKNLDNQADGCDAVIQRLVHVREVLKEYRQRAGQSWVTRVTA